MTNLIFWFITPPNNMKLFIEEVANIWNGSVTVIACHEMRAERKNTGYSEEIKNVDCFIILDKIKNPHKYAMKFIDDHHDDIHIFGGLRKEPAPYMYYLRGKYKNAKILAITEKPALNSGTLVKRIIKKVSQNIIYPLTYLKAMKAVDILLVVGNSGISAIKKYGWSRDNIYNFMYSDNNVSEDFSDKCESKVKYLYVGRFDYRMRGLDTLINAFDGLRDDNWSLSLVGGYGSDAAEVIEWANRTPNVSFLGTWAANEVMDKMKQFDVYICPVNEDSWNGQINMAISAGLAVISTNQAGSDELVSQSGAGKVIANADVVALRYAISQLNNNIEIVNMWKMNARNYAACISAYSLARYFIDLIDCKITKKSMVCTCPWLKNVRDGEE